MNSEPAESFGKWVTFASLTASLTGTTTLLRARFTGERPPDRPGWGALPGRFTTQQGPPVAGPHMIEDLHTAYWEEYEGGLHHRGSLIEQCKGLIDELNADHARDALAPTAFTRSTLSMHFYDSVVVFERGRHLRKHAPQIGGAGAATEARVRNDS